MAANIILTGFSGTGKSFVGKKVAYLLGWDFIDTDSEIEKRAGKSISRIFAEDGSPSFRALEKHVVKEACSGSHRVISTGGGAIVDEGNRELILGRGLLVSLDASPETIYARLGGESAVRLSDRPLLSGPDPLGKIRELIEARQKHYSMAHSTVDTNDLSIDQAAEAVVEKWREGWKTRTLQQK